MYFVAKKVTGLRNVGHKGLVLSLGILFLQINFFLTSYF